MFFTSGVIIDFVGTPFSSDTLINPMTYTVDATRHIMGVSPTGPTGFPLIFLFYRLLA